MSTREKRTTRRRQRVRDDILDVTRRLILEGGIAQLTLTAIAEELELTKPALYYYFKSKETLLFALQHDSMSEEVDAIEAAIAKAQNGAQAIEALIRAVANHYSGRLGEYRLVYLAGQLGESMRIPPEYVERIRPLNDRMYGRAAELIRADQAAGIAAASLDPRRTAFVAHCAVLGMLMMEGLIDAAGDEPLIHPQDAMIDSLVQAHTALLRG